MICGEVDVFEGSTSLLPTRATCASGQSVTRHPQRGGACAYNKDIKQRQPMTNYTSARTGNTYNVVAVPKSRTAYGEFMNPATKYIQEYTEYQIFLGDRKVQFAFEEEKVEEMIAHFEGVTDGWTSSPRD